MCVSLCLSVTFVSKIFINIYHTINNYCILNNFQKLKKVFKNRFNSYFKKFSNVYIFFFLKFYKTFAQFHKRNNNRKFYVNRIE